MEKLYTHYDNLRLARNAPPEVIRAAYKALAQKFHPDRNPGPDAARIMAIINAAYEVLSDPRRRIDYDEWLAQQEQFSHEPIAQEMPSPEPTPHPDRKSFFGLAGARKFAAHVLRNWRIYGFGTVAIWVYATNTPNKPSPGPKPYSSTPYAATPTFAQPSGVPNTIPPQSRPGSRQYARPPFAPTGEPWPVSAGYLTRAERLNSSGLSNIIIDNTRNNFDVFVKVVILSGTHAQGCSTLSTEGHCEH
jgi:hypothetical protein